jgi:hypothetical protein
MKDHEQDFRITRLEQEVDFFRKTTEQSLVENGKKMDRVISVLENDDSIGKIGLVKKVNELENRLVSLRNFIRAYKLAIAMLAGLFTAIGSAVTYYINWLKG